MVYSKNNPIFFINIISISVIVILCVVYYINNSYNKTVYLVWNNLVKGAPISNGFGDKLRAAIATYQYCKDNNFRFVLDATDDICGKFLKNVKSKEYNHIRGKKIIHIDCPNGPEHCDFETLVASELKARDDVFIYTNKCPKNDDCVSYKKGILTSADKEFAKHICEPMDFLKKEVDETIQTLTKNYGIQHFRFKDSVFKEDIDENDPTFIKFFNILKETHKSTDVLLSNSTNFKEYAKKQLNIKTIECNGKPCKMSHIGKTSDVESAKVGFIEFYVISKAKYVNTVSKYEWVSNFVKWPCLIYDVPLEEHVVH
ncbi:hypothetical protein EBV26_12730 [bacterium]|nr:hypothetical protein [bacterium]